MTDNIGKSAFPAVQASPSFSSAFKIPLKNAPDMPCLIPCAIDQVDCYFLLVFLVNDIYWTLLRVLGCLFPHDQGRSSSNGAPQAIPDPQHFLPPASRQGGQDERICRPQCRVCHRHTKAGWLGTTLTMFCRADSNSTTLLLPLQIKDKINKHAFSGGRETLELQVQLLIYSHIKFSQVMFPCLFSCSVNLAQIWV